MRIKDKKRFLMGGLLLSVTALLMRFSGILFNGYITGKLGSSGMGLITLVMSVYSFAVTFATSGIHLSATRLVAEALGCGCEREVRPAMRRCFLYALLFGCSAMLLLLGFSSLLGEQILGDQRTALALRILSPALPCIALSSAMGGYFTAVRRVQKSAAASVLEQSVKIALTALLLSVMLPYGIEYAAAAVVAGSCTAEAASCLLSAILYRLDLKKHIGESGHRQTGGVKRLLQIALPVAFTAYARSGLLTVEHLLIPIGLQKGGASRETALAAYGAIQSMSLPVVLFPMAILSSFTSLLIPEFAEAKAKGEGERIRSMTGKVIGGTLLFALCALGPIALFADELSLTLYHTDEAARYLRLFAFLIPFMYLDSAVDAMLKGLGEQVYAMKVNILDAGLSTLLVALLLPFTGIDGYAALIFGMEILNLTLSFHRLYRVSGISLKPSPKALLPLLALLTSTAITAFSHRLVIGTNETGLAPLCLLILWQISLYLLLCLLFSGKPRKKQDRIPITTLHITP